MAVRTRNHLITAWPAPVFAAAAALCAAHAADPANGPEPSDHAAAVAVFAPQVEFLSMETDAHIDAPKADVDTLSAALADQISQALSDHGIDERRIDRVMVEASDGAADYNDIVKGIKRGRGQAFDNASAVMSDIAADREVLIIRARFYLDYWARSGRGWQVAQSVLLADRSDKRLVIDARVYRASDLSERARLLLQDRVTPRTADEELEEIAQRIADEFWNNKNEGENDD